MPTHLVVWDGGVEVSVPADEDGGGAVVELLGGEPGVVQRELATTEDRVHAVAQLLRHPTLLGGPENVQRGKELANDACLIVLTI